MERREPKKTSHDLHIEVLPSLHLFSTSPLDHKIKNNNVVSLKLLIYVPQHPKLAC